MNQTPKGGGWLRELPAFLALAVIAAAMIVCSGCAAPGSTTKIPVGAAVALAGMDPSDLPPEAWSGPPVEIDLRWYDRTVAVQVDRDSEGAHWFDLTSSASGENALEARRSDNQRATSNLEILRDLFLAGAAAAAPALAARAAPRAPPAAAPLPDLEEVPADDGLSPLDVGNPELPVVEFDSPEARARELAELRRQVEELRAAAAAGAEGRADG